MRVRTTLAMVSILLLCTTAQAQSSRDLAARLDGADDRLRRVLADSLSVPPLTVQGLKLRNLGTATIVPETRPKHRLGARVGVTQEFSEPGAMTRLGQLGATWLDAELQVPGASPLFLTASLSQEAFFAGDVLGELHGETNLAAAVAPRVQWPLGSGGFIGFEAAFEVETGFSVGRVWARPFFSYALSRCAFVAGAAGILTDVGPEQGGEDAAAWSVEGGFGCVISGLDSAGLHARMQFGLGLNDEGTAVDRDGLPLRRGVTTRDANMWSVRPFYHHRFTRGPGLELATEIGRMEDGARATSFFYADLWQSYTAALEWPLGPSWSLSFRAEGRFGLRQRDAAGGDPNKRRFEDEFRYTEARGVIGVDWRF